MDRNKVKNTGGFKWNSNTKNSKWFKENEQEFREWYFINNH